jgi:L-aminopeptidase/D-esterase-like protein
MRVANRAGSGYHEATMPPGFGPIPGIKVGHAQDEKALTGCTVLLCDPTSAYLGAKSIVAGCDVRGAASGERELETVRPSHLVEGIHALLLAGGSAFGLDAAAGVVRWCEEHGHGFDTGVARVPIVPTAIIYDLQIGDSQRRPDAEMGYAAARAAANTLVGAPVAEGNVGVGMGATVGKFYGIKHAMKAGVGCWTETVRGAGGTDVRVAALAVANAFGDIRDPETGKLIAGTRTSADSMDLLDTAAAMCAGNVVYGFPDTNTVLVAVVTNATLSRVEAQRLAVMASAGMARTLSPAHTTYDGDIVFALSLGSLRADVNALGAAAAKAVERAIIRSVTQAKSAGGVPGLAGP